MPLATKAKEFSLDEVRILTKQVRKRYDEPIVKFDMTVSDKDGEHFQHVFTVEDPPRTLFVSYSEDHGPVDRYQIMKPISYMNVHFNRHGLYKGAVIFFSKEKIRSVHAPIRLLYAPLPNIGYDFHVAPVIGICMGNHTMHGTSMQDKALKYNAHFWNSKFNDQIEWTSAVDPFMKGRVDYGFPALLDKWQKCTEKKQLPKFKSVRGSMGKSIRHAAEALMNALLGID